MSTNWNADPSNPDRYQDVIKEPFSATVNSYLNASGISALQTQLTGVYSDLSFTYTGGPGQYVITLYGSKRSVLGSINVIFPPTTPFTLVRSQMGPTFGKYNP